MLHQKEKQTFQQNNKLCQLNAIFQGIRFHHLPDLLSEAASNCNLEAMKLFSVLTLPEGSSMVSFPSARATDFSHICEDSARKGDGTRATSPTPSAEQHTTAKLETPPVSLLLVPPTFSLADSQLSEDRIDA